MSTTTTYSPSEPKTDLHRLRIKHTQRLNGLAIAEAAHERKMATKREQIAELEAQIAELENQENN